MKLIEKIKNLINLKPQEHSKISSINTVEYDTSLVYIPKYKELTEEEKLQVDRYVKETDTTQIENVILYDTVINKYSEGVTELLLNVAYRVSGKNSIDKVSKLSTQEILNLRVEAMTAIEEMNFYELVLRDLEREAILRTVALKQIYIKEKRDFKTFDILEKAEKIRIQNTEASFEATIERMRINKKIIEQQIQSVMNWLSSNDRLAQTISIYKSLLTDIDTEHQTREILEVKKQDLLKMVKVVDSEKLSNIKEGTDEESKIKEIAKLQCMLEIYAYIHKEDINQLKQRIKELDTVEKTDKNRDKLLKELSDIRVKYRVFGRYIKDEDLENLYKVKFDTLMTDINNRKESPLLDLKEDNEELQYYKRIIKSKIDQILTLNNPKVEIAFGTERVQEVVELVTNILMNDKKTLDTGKILQDTTLLRLILAFDKENGLESMTINKEDAKAYLHEKMYEWEDIIPLRSVFKIGYEDNNTISSQGNEYIKLYNMYNEQHPQKNDKYNCGVDDLIIYIIPEGITKIKIGPKQDFERLILPSTLKEIGPYSFKSYYRLHEIEFNDGLEVIGNRAFENCDNIGATYKKLKFPKTLKEIGSRAFYNCLNLGPLILNEGLTTIGKEAFNCDRFYLWHSKVDDGIFNPITIIILPNSIKDVGHNIVNCTEVTHLGFKNYRGQLIPEEVFKTWYHYRYNR